MGARVWIWVVSGALVSGFRDACPLRLLPFGGSGIFKEVLGVKTLWFDGKFQTVNEGNEGVMSYGACRFIDAIMGTGFAGCLWSIIIRSSHRVYGEHYFDRFVSFGITRPCLTFYPFHSCV
jgi:hypothetical protein